MRQSLKMKGVHVKVRRGGLQWMCGATQISSLSLAHSFAQGHRCWWRRTQSKSLLWNGPPLKELPPWGKLIVSDYSWDQCGEHTVA